MKNCEISIQVANSCKTYFKCERTIKQSINKSLDTLKTRIRSYEESGTQFGKIFNDETVKYDVYKNNLYAFKARDNKLQIRLLYTVEITTTGLTIILIDFALKKTSDKSYITKFTELARNFALNNIELIPVAIYC